MKEIHVLHVLNSTSGGSALSTFQLIKALKSEGVKSSLICFDNGSEELKQEIADLVEGRALFRKLHWMNKRIRARGWKRYAVELLDRLTTWKGHRYQKSFVTFAINHKIDIIHTSTILNPEGAILAKKLSLPHIFHGRELIGPGQPYTFYRFDSWKNWISNHSDTIIANSQITQELYENHFSKESLVHISNGIPLEAFELKKERNTMPLIVGMVGHLTSRWKNHSMFVDIAIGAIESGLPLEFRMYGNLPLKEDEYVSELREKIRQANLEDDIKIMGYVDDPVKVMNELDILLHTARHESFGRIFIEAMAAHLPIIAYAAGGALNLVRHQKNGFLFEKVDDAINYLTQLADKPELRSSVGHEGRKLTEQKFDIKLVAKRIKALYSILLKTNPNKAL